MFSVTNYSSRRRELNIPMEYTPSRNSGETNEDFNIRCTMAHNEYIEKLANAEARWHSYQIAVADYEKAKGKCPAAEQVASTFRELDAQNKGHITAEELSLFTKRFQISQADRIFAKYSNKQTQVFDLDAFDKLCVDLRSIVKTFDQEEQRWDKSDEQILWTCKYCGFGCCLCTGCVSFCCMYVYDSCTNSAYEKRVLTEEQRLNDFVVAELHRGEPTASAAPMNRT